MLQAVLSVSSRTSTGFAIACKPSYHTNQSYCTPGCRPLLYTDTYCVPARSYPLSPRFWHGGLAKRAYHLPLGPHLLHDTWVHRGITCILVCGPYMGCRYLLATMQVAMLHREGRIAKGSRIPTVRLAKPRRLRASLSATMLRCNGVQTVLQRILTTQQRTRS